MKYFVAIALIGVALVGELAQAGRLSSHDWQLFKKQHGKSYESPAEEARRFALFTATKQRVERHNAKGDSSFKMGLNHLADWTQEELAKLNGVKVDAVTLAGAQEQSSEDEAYLAEILASSSEPVPAELDWRTVPGRVTSVKDQGQCGSCWAFASVGVLEGQEYGRVFNKSGDVVQLSEQELLDCSTSNDGCNGGIMSLAFNDLNKLGGIESTRAYPYKATGHKCAFNKKKVVMTDAGAVMVPAMNETNIMQYVAKFGPVSIAMQATDNFQMYKKGVFADRTCTSSLNDINHGVLLVGYGTDPKQGDYWIVKNSWGPHWGEKGYFKIKRGVNMCSIATLPTIARF